MATVNKCGLQEMLQSVLSTSAAEQNMSYPPLVYQNHYNIVTSWLKSKIAEVYPTNIRFKDIVNPFFRNRVLPVKNGQITLPDDYRNYLDILIPVNTNQSGGCEAGCEDCNDNDNPEIAARIFQQEIVKSKCLNNPLTIVESSEWAYRTRDPFDMPTFKNPIGMWVDKDTIRICPVEIARVQFIYLANEKYYNYGYIMQPDDTYINDPDKTDPTEWDTNAFEPLFKGICALYGAYTRDAQFTNFVQILNQIGLT